MIDRITRRDFLKYAGTVTGSALLAACAPKSTPDNNVTIAPPPNRLPRGDIHEILPGCHEANEKHDNNLLYPRVDMYFGEDSEIAYDLNGFSCVSKIKCKKGIKGYTITETNCTK